MHTLRQLALFWRLNTFKKKKDDDLFDMKIFLKTKNYIVDYHIFITLNEQYDQKKTAIIFQTRIIKKPLHEKFKNCFY